MKAALCALICAFPVLSSEPPAQDAPAVAEPLKQTLVVTGSPEPVPLEEADRSVLLLPVRDKAILFNTLMDVLRLDPSIDLRQRGANGMQADISLRGASFSQVLVLVNGRRMNDPQSGHHHLDLPIPMEAVERVEVLRGAGSTLYGADAAGGVVQFITRPAERGEARLQTGLGNFGSNQQRVSLTGVRGGLGQSLALSRDFSTGFMQGRDFRGLAAHAGTSWSNRAGATGVDLAFSDRAVGANQFYGNFNSWERTKTWMASIRQNLGSQTEASLGYRRHTDLFVLHRDRPQAYTNHHVAESWHGSLRRRETIAQNVSLFYGTEGFGDEIDSTNLGRHSRVRAAAYGLLDVRVLKRFSLSAGMRAESHRGLSEWNPSLAAGYWASSHLKLRAGVSRAFRLPTFTDLYYRDPANQGDPGLRPEQAWNYEAGADLRPSTKWRLQGTVFRRLDSNMIDYARFSAFEPWQAMNVTRLRFAGVEASAAWQGRAQVLEWSYTGLNGSAEPVAGLQSKYAFNYAVHSGIFSWTGNLPGGVAVRSRAGALDRFGRDAYGVWDLSATRAFGRVRPYVQFGNLTDTRYEEIAGVRMPGRSFIAGVELVWQASKK
ncbi:MAG: TonB-dependent receptor [Bryobacteraceae bacterium]|nr:TonB-dependent receptor [Bryobacteraceae bacterium]